MTLTLYFHPLSSFCQKALAALYENGTAFTGDLIDLGDPLDRARFLKIAPLGQFPVLHDAARDRIVAESSIIIEYLDQHYPGATTLIPTSPDAALETRRWDRFFDVAIHVPMQKVVGDRIRPAGGKDPIGVAAARARIRTGYDIIERELAGRRWALGDRFSMGDCSAAPALYYSRLVEPFGPQHSVASAYFERLMERPSVARAVREADPYRHMFPTE